MSLTPLATALLLLLATACSGRHTSRSTPSDRNAAPPLVNSDSAAFDGPAAPPTPIDGSGGAGAGNGSGGGGFGNGSGGGSGSSRDSTDGQKGAAVPEPGTILLVGTGLAAAALSRKRRKNAPAA